MQSYLYIDTELQSLSNHPLEQSNHTLMSVFHYTDLLSVLISYTSKYRVIIAVNPKSVIKRWRTTNIDQSYLIEILFCAPAAWLWLIYITIITPIMAFINITITILIVLVNTVVIHTTK